MIYLVQKRCLHHNLPLRLVFECKHRATGSLLQHTRQHLQDRFFPHLKTLLEAVECSIDHFLCCSKDLNAIRSRRDEVLAMLAEFSFSRRH